MKRYNRFKMLNNIQDQYILESMPDYQILRAKKRRNENPVIRFFNSGWGVACICTVVALTVMAFILRIGQDPWGTPAGSHEETGSEIIETLPITETELPSADTEASTESETEGETIPEFDISDVIALETYQGMRPNIPYTLSFRSYGDGTCVVDGITVNILYNGEFAVEIPETSPAGDTVIGLRIKPTYNIPTYILAEDFEEIHTALKLHFETPDNFYYKQFMSYFRLYSADLSSTPALRQDMIDMYPLCEFVPVYVFDPTATDIEWALRSRELATIAPWYTDERCYADLWMAQTIAESIGVTDPALEAALAAHSGDLKNATDIKLPKTLKPRGEDLVNSSPSIHLDVLSLMGIDHMTFDGTVAEMIAIADPANTYVDYPMVIHCSDGDVSYPIEE